MRGLLIGLLLTSWLAYADDQWGVSECERTSEGRRVLVECKLTPDEMEWVRDYREDACRSATKTVLFGSDPSDAISIVCLTKSEVRRMELRHKYPLGPKWRAKEGYQGARWGMSRAEVRKVFPKAAVAKRVLQFTGTVAGYEARTAFYFVNDRLTNVTIRFPNQRGEVRSDEDMFDALAAALSEKYGEETLVDDYTWELPETRITIERTRFAIGYDVEISYSSIDLARLVEKAEKNAAADL